MKRVAALSLNALILPRQRKEACRSKRMPSELGTLRSEPRASHANPTHVPCPTRLRPRPTRRLFCRLLYRRLKSGRLAARIDAIHTTVQLRLGMPGRSQLSPTISVPNDPAMRSSARRNELVMRNATMMSHPMHLHGHSFQVTEIDGQSSRARCAMSCWCRRARR